MLALATPAQDIVRTRTFTLDTLVWEGVTLLVSYEAAWLGLGHGELEDPTAHLELQVLFPRGAPLPVTDSGYRSEFLPCGLVEAAGGAEAFTRRWLDERKDTLFWRVARARWELREPWCGPRWGCRGRPGRLEGCGRLARVRHVVRARA